MRRVTAAPVSAVYRRGAARSPSVGRRPVTVRQRPAEPAVPIGTAPLAQQRITARPAPPYNTCLSCLCACLSRTVNGPARVTQQNGVTRASFITGSGTEGFRAACCGPENWTMWVVRPILTGGSERLKSASASCLWSAAGRPAVPTWSGWAAAGVRIGDRVTEFAAFSSLLAGHASDQAGGSSRLQNYIHMTDNKHLKDHVFW